MSQHGRCRRHDEYASKQVPSSGVRHLQASSPTTGGIQMTVTTLILLVMAAFVAVFALRIFGSRFLK